MYFLSCEEIKTIIIIIIIIIIINYCANFVLLSAVQTNNISLVKPGFQDGLLSMKPLLNQESCRNEFTCLFVSRITLEKNLGLPVSV